MNKDTRDYVNISISPRTHQMLSLLKNDPKVREAILRRYFKPGERKRVTFDHVIRYLIDVFYECNRARGLVRLEV